MNREILFRGKQNHNGIWIEGHYSKDYAGVAYITTLDGVSTGVVDESTLGQFTGLCDKNGVKIFEGDILNGSMYHDVVVEWDSTHCGWNITGHAQTTQVTGNIHDEQS